MQPSPRSEGLHELNAPEIQESLKEERRQGRKKDGVRTGGRENCDNRAFEKLEEREQFELCL